MGRALGNAIVNLDIDAEIAKALDTLGLDLEELPISKSMRVLEMVVGRLANALLIMATLEYPAYGMGIRYEYGIFHQKIENGQQIEKPDNWLTFLWEIARPQYSIKVPFGLCF